MYKYQSSIVSIIAILIFCFTSILAEPLNRSSDVADSDGYSTDPLLIYNAKIVDLEAQKVREGALLVEDDKISDVFSSVPENFNGRKLNAEGRWVMPGLYDMHVHSSGNKNLEFEDMPPISTAHSSKVMLYAGVTGFLDLFANEDTIFNLREDQRKGKHLGADIYAAGPILTAPGGHGTQFHTETRTVSSPKEARSTVENLSSQNPDVVKLVYNPDQVKDGSLTSMDRETMQALIDEAQQHDLKTVVHFGSWGDAYEAVKAGVSAITHTRTQPVPDSLISLMEQKGTAWIPTLAVFTGLPQIAQNPQILDDPLLKAVTNADLRSSFREDMPKKVKKYVQNGFDKTKKQFFANVMKFYKAGIPVLAGTDSGNVGAILGFSLHQELELYTRAGISVWDALYSATIQPGKFLEVESGVQPGDRANLVILNKSPIENIRNTKDISQVIFHGQILDRSDLIEATQLANSSP